MVEFKEMIDEKWYSSSTLRNWELSIKLLSDSWLTGSELARELGISRAGGFRIIKQLQYYGYKMRHDKQGSWHCDGRPD